MYTDIILHFKCVFILHRNNASQLAYAGFVQGGGFNHAGPEKADERGGGGGGTPTHIFFVIYIIG